MARFKLIAVLLLAVIATVLAQDATTLNGADNGDVTTDDSSIQPDDTVATSPAPSKGDAQPDKAEPADTHAVEDEEEAAPVEATEVETELTETEPVEAEEAIVETDDE